jgi:hypothetical protein
MQNDTTPTPKPDYLRNFEDGTIDDTTFEQLETMLDRLNAPATGENGEWLKLDARIEALIKATPFPVIQTPRFDDRENGGVTEVRGKKYMSDAKGSLVPLEMIKPQDKLEDETVRKVMFYARQLSAQVGRFKAHTFNDLSAFEALLAQEYSAAKGGTKGNKTFLSFDGLMKVQVAVADLIDFGPQLQIAKSLIDECLTEWAADSRAEIRALVTSAFNTDKGGLVNRSEIFMLLRLDIEDARWKQAMDAIRAAMRIVGSKTYIRVYERETHDGQWQAVTIDLAKA